MRIQGINADIPNVSMETPPFSVVLNFKIDMTHVFFSSCEKLLIFRPLFRFYRDCIFLIFSSTRIVTLFEFVLWYLLHGIP